MEDEAQPRLRGLGGRATPTAQCRGVVYQLLRAKAVPTPSVRGRRLRCPGARRSDLAEQGQRPLRTDQFGGPLFESYAVHAGEIRPPLCGIRIEHLEHQHETSLGGVILAQAVAHQWDGAGSLESEITCREVPEREFLRSKGAPTGGKITDREGIIT